MLEEIELLDEEDTISSILADLTIKNLFGFAPEDRIAVLFEPIFLLMYYMGFTWESFGMGPLTTAQRRWFVGRLNDEIERSNKNPEANEIPTKSPMHNMPDVRQMMGKMKPFTPNARMQRAS